MRGVRREVGGGVMVINQLIDMLTAIETRHTGEVIEVEILDEHGTRTSDIHVKTEYIIPSRRITVMIVPMKEENDG